PSLDGRRTCGAAESVYNRGKDQIDMRNMNFRSSVSAWLTIFPVVLLAIVASSSQQTNPSLSPSQSPLPTAVPGDFVIKDFKFEDGETLPELKLHYVTL